jgi:hypothetical protein
VLVQGVAQPLDFREARGELGNAAAGAAIHMEHWEHLHAQRAAHLLVGVEVHFQELDVAALGDNLDKLQRELAAKRVAVSGATGPHVLGPSARARRPQTRLPQKKRITRLRRSHATAAVCAAHLRVQRLARATPRRVEMHDN